MPQSLTDAPINALCIYFAGAWVGTWSGYSTALQLLINADINGVGADLTISQQAKIFANSDVVIAVHGACTGHMVFLPHNAAFIEVRLGQEPM